MARQDVTEGALIKRINRHLASESKTRGGPTQRLFKSRGDRAASAVGQFYVLEVDRNRHLADHVNIEKMGRDLGVLEKEERLQK